MLSTPSPVDAAVSTATAAEENEDDKQVYDGRERPSIAMNRERGPSTLFMRSVSEFRAHRHGQSDLS